MRFLLLCLLVGATLLSYQQGWLDSAKDEWDRYLREKKAGGDAAEMDGRAVTGILAARQRLGAGTLMPDLQLQQWLLERLETGPTDADSLVTAVQQEWPQYVQAAALRSHSATADGLMEQLTGWSELGTKDLSHLAVMVEPAAFGLGWQGTVLAGHRLPVFSPESLNGSKEDEFYSVCTLCKKGQPCQIPRHSRSLALECPHCKRVYAMLAADSRGRFRYVNEYLTGYAPPARYPKGQTRLAELMTIWRAVAGGCRYAMDNGDNENDSWQTAQETQALGQGDCEDSSILLADWLIARDFQARVAIGRYAERGGHAWVVVRLEGQDYLLESTEGASKEKRPPLLAEVGSRYVPELLFDHLAFFIRNQPDALWNSDFWGDATWKRVVPRERRSSSGKVVTQVTGGAE